MPLGIIGRYLPPAVKRAARDAWQARVLRRAVERLLAVAPGCVPDRRVTRELRDAWGNEGFTGHADFLHEVARWAAVTPGPVLECGSGLTTILLGALAGRRGVEIWTLEHDPRWHARVARVLLGHRIRGVRLCLTPLRDFGPFTWYEAPLDRLPDVFRLVVCDGPPASTPGGRYGMVPILRHRLPSDAMIVLDDAARASEAEMLQRWMDEAPVRVRLFESSEGCYALIKGP